MCLKAFSIVKWLVIHQSMGLIPHCREPAVQAHVEELEEVRLSQKLPWGGVRVQRKVQAHTLNTHDLLFLYFLANSVPHWNGLQKGTHTCRFVGSHSLVPLLRCLNQVVIQGFAAHIAIAPREPDTGIRRAQYKHRSEGCLGAKDLTIEVKSLGKQKDARE